MRVLLVEDDDAKREELVEFLRHTIPDVKLTSANSYRSGIDAVLEGEFDLIVLDMTLVTFDVASDEDGGAPRPYAGREILSQMERHGVETPAIVVTMHDRFTDGSQRMTLAELDAHLTAEYRSVYRGSVHYSLNEDWHVDLVALLQQTRPEGFQ